MSGPQNIHNYLQKKQFVQSSKWQWTWNTRQCICLHGQSYISLNHCENGYLRKTTIFLNQFPQTRHQLIKIKPLWIFETTRIRWCAFYYINNPTHTACEIPVRICFSVFFCTHNSLQLKTGCSKNLSHFVR